MILEYNAKTAMFFLRVTRGEADPTVLMKDHGLDLSVPASGAGTAVLYTREPYAAASFAEHATAAAKAELQPLLDRIASSWKDDSNGHYRCPADKELWPFQRADLEYALGRDHTLIGDQPGLGKTPTAICFANEISAKRVLVLCPANIRLQWATRIREWSTQRWPYVVYPILNAQRGVHPEAEWTIVSYDLARTEAIGRALARGTYDLLILDEAHYLKTPDSQRTRAVFGGGEKPLFDALASRCGSTLALTGTPLPNRPREAYTLARALCFDSIDWLSEEKFKERFNPSAVIETVNKDGRTSRYIREEVGRTGELQNRLRANFMVRHLKRDVMPQLKLPVYDLIMVDETAAVKQALEAESLLHIDPDTDLEHPDIEVLGHIAVVRHAMGIAMAPQVVDYAKMLLDGGEDKLVIFAWHVEVLNILQRGLEKFGVIRIDGSVPPSRKQVLVDQYIAEPKKQILIGNMQSVGVGTDGLQKVCWHALFAETDWVAGNNEQCVDRLDRGGQTGAVQADFFVAQGSIAERILATALRKRQNTHKALDRRGA